MAIANFVASSGSSANNSTITVAHTPNGGADRVLVVGVAWFGNPTISALTYAGSSILANHRFTRQYSGEARLQCAAYYLINPGTGANNAIVTLTGSVEPLMMGVVSWTGGHQTVPFGTDVTAEGTATPVSVSLALAADEYGLDIACPNSSAQTVGADQTSRVSLVNIGGTSTSLAMSTEAGTGATQALTWAVTLDVARWVSGGLILKPAGAAVTGRSQLIGGKLVGGTLVRN
jgi:hypothetical protein